MLRQKRPPRRDTAAVKNVDAIPKRDFLKFVLFISAIICIRATIRISALMHINNKSALLLILHHAIRKADKLNFILRFKSIVCA
ncbi:hypothetical protein C7R88_06880 [Plesiomonas shigelloides]|nr:hypothetical protein C7R88_06880 [Plesiomonas shigelloides]